MNNDDDDDDMARLRAEMDQAKEGSREFAKNLWAFYSECRAQGFNEDQAMALTLTYMGAVLS
jgi:hypothetical protein